MISRDLDRLSRDELIAQATELQVERAPMLTRPELIDEIVRRAVVDPLERGRARGLFGLARDLLARVVERGLHLPDTAAKIRGPSSAVPMPATKPPLATVLLAEIYADQGHHARALRVLDEVLLKEPDHTEAGALRERISKLVEPADGAIAAIAAVEEDGTADELVAVPFDAEMLLLSWKVCETSIQRARSERRGGGLVIRVLTASPTWKGPILEQRDLEVSDRNGERWLRNLPRGAEIRGALGWREAGEFEPLAVADDPCGPAGDLSEVHPTDIKSRGATRFSDLNEVDCSGATGASRRALAAETHF